MVGEMNSLTENNTSASSVLPEGKNAVGSLGVQWGGVYNGCSKPY